MNINRIVSELKSERQLLDNAIKAIEGMGGRGGKGRTRASVVTISSGRRPRLSADARRRISEAQKRRWARMKKVA